MGELVCLHVLFNSIDNFDDVIYIFFKFFSFLEAGHADQVGFLLIKLT